MQCATFAIEDILGPKTKRDWVVYGRPPALSSTRDEEHDTLVIQTARRPIRPEALGITEPGDDLLLVADCGTARVVPIPVPVVPALPVASVIPFRPRGKDRYDVQTPFRRLIEYGFPFPGSLGAAFTLFAQGKPRC